MDDQVLDDIYKINEIDAKKIESLISIGTITEREKFKAAKQILFGLAFLYVMTIAAYLYKPIEGNKLLDICTTTFPPLATLILVAYFRDKTH